MTYYNLSHIIENATNQNTEEPLYILPALAIIPQLGIITNGALIKAHRIVSFAVHCAFLKGSCAFA